jgi:hypothetical protein
MPWMIAELPLLNHRPLGRFDVRKACCLVDASSDS